MPQIAAGRPSAEQREDQRGDSGVSNVLTEQGHVGIRREQTPARNPRAERERDGVQKGQTATAMAETGEFQRRQNLGGGQPCGNQRGEEWYDDGPEADLNGPLPKTLYVIMRDRRAGCLAEYAPQRPDTRSEEHTS